SGVILAQALVAALRAGTTYGANPRGRRDAVRVLQRRREPRLRLGLGDRQPDDLLGLLRRAGPGRTADTPDPPGAGHGHLRHAYPSRRRAEVSLFFSAFRRVARP